MRKKTAFFLLALSAAFANVVEAAQARTIDLTPVSSRLFSGVFFFALVAIVLALLKKLLRGQREYSYEKIDALLTPAEVSFFHVLEDAVGGEFRLFAKVRLADFIRVKAGLDGGLWRGAFNSIASKHIDFLACDPRTCAIKFAVELDDSTHQREARKVRDEFVDRVLATIGVPLFRFSVRYGYSVQEIRRVIFERLRSADKAAAEMPNKSARTFDF